jgi:hypothetical protein
MGGCVTTWPAFRRAVLQIPMAKPPTSVRSIRLSDEAWAWLTEEAERSGESVNGLVVRMVAAARAPAIAVSVGEGIVVDVGHSLVAAVRHEQERRQAELDTSLYSKRENNIPTSRKVRQAFSQPVQIGPSRRAPGSLLKGPKK